MAHECGTQPDWDLRAMATQDMEAEAGRESPKRKAEAEADVPTTRQKTDDAPPAQLVNLTPHDFDLYNKDSELVATVPKSDFVLRTENARAPAQCELTFGGITMLSDEDVPQQLHAEDVEKLAEYKGRAIILSRIAAETLMQYAKTLRNPIGVYVITPNSAPDSVVRDGKGGIVGVKRVLRWGWC